MIRSTQRITKQNKKKSQVTFELASSLKEKLERYAQREKRSISFVVRSAVEQLLDEAVLRKAAS